MTSVSNAQSVALLILQQASATSASPEQRKDDKSVDLVNLANGQVNKVRVSAQPGQAQSRISESLFSVNNVNINRLKLDLIDRAGEALGIDHADYASRDEFVNVMQKALSDLRIQGGLQAVIGLEKELGLDKLGISIDDVVNSASDPESDDKLTKAMEKQAGKDTGRSDEDDNVPPFALQPDALGLYGTFNR